MWRRTSRFHFLALLAGTFLTGATASATVVEKLSIEDMTRRAERVVRGIVRSQHTSWSEGRARILTFTEIEVVQSLKGEAGPVLVMTPGGTLDGLTDWPSGTPRLVEGEEVILFLEKAPGGNAWVHLGMSSTVFHLGGVGEKRVVSRAVGGLGFAVLAPDRPMSIESPGSDVEQLGTLKAVEKRILSALRK